MDPAFSLFEGTTTSTDGISVFDGGTDMDWLGILQDDDVDDSFGGCREDPELFYTLPHTATYTLAVFDVDGCSTPSDPLVYEIHTSGIDCNVDPDTDGDGCLDSVDTHPNSNADATVIIDGCDSGVANIFVTDCSTMSDLIADCAEAAIDHGDFVSCVAHLTNDWKAAGLITGREKGAIQSCAAQSNIPYP